MKKNILSKCVVNKVNFKGETYLRLYNINEEKEQKGTFINLKVFRELKKFVYIPFYYEECKDEELIRRIRATDIDNDILVDLNEIERYLIGVDMYISNTYDVVKTSSESFMTGYDMVLYKEYMGVFYVVLSSKEESCIYEVRLDREGKFRLLYLEQNIVDFIVRRDLYRFIEDETQMCLRVFQDRYIIITDILGKQCFLDVEVFENNKYNLKSVKFNVLTKEENITLPLDVINKKIERIMSSRKEKNRV